MFSIDFLNTLRSYELDYIERFLFTGASILEIGGGTGVQARELSNRGYQVSSVDIEASSYTTERVFPIIDYDGKHLPFPDSKFDIILSSNVLEHILDREALYQEFERVLKPGGYAVHVMPTGTWRWWTNITNYMDLFHRWLLLIPQLIPRRVAKGELIRIAKVPFEAMKYGAIYIIPRRHGETGNALFEIWTFSQYWWLRHFRKNNYNVVVAEPMGLFYTGHMILGDKLSMTVREKLAKWLGSSCVLYKVRKTTNP